MAHSSPSLRWSNSPPARDVHTYPRSPVVHPAPLIPGKWHSPHSPVPHYRPPHTRHQRGQTPVIAAGHYIPAAASPHSRLRSTIQATLPSLASSGIRSHSDVRRRFPTESPRTSSGATFDAACKCTPSSALPQVCPPSTISDKHAPTDDHQPYRPQLPIHAEVVRSASAVEALPTT